MTPTATGRAAEQYAATYLAGQGYTIVEQNWRTRFCEIDIIARHNGVVHVVEVKYRANTCWGSATEYISYDKSQRLHRAALAWCQANNYSGPIQIDVISVEGPIISPRIQHIPNAIAD